MPTWKRQLKNPSMFSLFIVRYSGIQFYPRQLQEVTGSIQALLRLIDKQELAPGSLILLLVLFIRDWLD